MLLLTQGQIGLKNILLVDNHNLLYSGIHAILSANDDFNLIEFIASDDQLPHSIHHYAPDIVLLALNVTQAPGVNIVGFLKKKFPAVRFIVLLDTPDESSLQELSVLNVAGIILKSDVSKLLLEAINAVSQGKQWISPTLMLAFLHSQRTQSVDKLTDRELMILRLLEEEKTDKEIALAVSLAERSVRSHLAHIYVKLGVKTRVGAAVMAVKLKLI